MDEGIFKTIISAVSDVISSITDYIADLFEKPTNLDEYYTVGKIMISKKIVKLIFIILAIISTIYLIIILPEKIEEYFSNKDSNRIYTKYYTSRSLKSYEGVAKIISKKNEAKYIGEISGGSANGKGVLYDKHSKLLYNGDFVLNEYSGEGILYYSDGYAQYIGEFKKNLFDGKGKLYYVNHKLNYEGDFMGGRKNGNGLLYNSLGTEIFLGIFIDDKPAIDRYLGVAADELKDHFFESGQIYSYDNKTCIIYKNLGIMVVLTREDEALENSGEVKQIYFFNNSYFSNEPKLERNKLDKKMSEMKGIKKYTGYTRVLFNEMSAIDYLKKIDESLYTNFSKYDFSGQFSDVFEAKSGKTNDKIYVQAYEANDLEYIFYFNDKNEPYIFYSIERAS